MSGLMSPGGDTKDLRTIISEATKMPPEYLPEGLATSFEILTERTKRLKEVAEETWRAFLPLAQPLAELEETGRRQEAAAALAVARAVRHLGIPVEIQVVTQQRGGSRLVVRHLPRWSDL